MQYNPYILVPLATWAVAQIAKFAIAAMRGRIDFRYLYASGGMPSVHSAVVCSLATTALLVDGAQSHLFGLAIILAAIVMYDSFGVRRSSGEQAAAINMLIGSLDRNRVRIDQPDLHLREILGHKPKEVTVGAVVGVVLAALFNYQHLGAFGAFVQATPGKVELYAYVGLFIFVVIVGAAVRFILRARYPKSKVIKQLASRILVATQLTGWLGLFSTALVYEHASYFAWRLWPLLVLAVGVVWKVVLIWTSYRAVPAGLAEESSVARKLKWINWGRGKKRKAKQK